MALVLIAIVQAAVECPVNLTFLFFVSVACIYIVTGALHFDPITLMCGIIYWLLIPSCFIFLQVIHSQGQLRSYKLLIGLLHR